MIRTGSTPRSREVTGYSASVIACDAEAGLECRLSADETPDGRTGAAVLLFGFSTAGLAKSVANRTGQCLMTCPSTAVYDGLPDGTERIALGKHLRFFGDGYQKSKLVGGRRYWRIPVMDGEFLVAETVGVSKGVAGGNIILQAVSRAAGLGRGPPGCRGSGGNAGGHHTLSGRSRAQRKQSRVPLQGTHGLHVRRFLPDAAGAGRIAFASGGPLRV